MLPIKDPQAAWVSPSTTSMHKACDVFREWHCGIGHPWRSSWQVGDQGAWLSAQRCPQRKGCRKAQIVTFHESSTSRESDEGIKHTSDEVFSDRDNLRSATTWLCQWVKGGDLGHFWSCSFCCRNKLLRNESATILNIVQAVACWKGWLQHASTHHSLFFVTYAHAPICVAGLVAEAHGSRHCPYVDSEFWCLWHEVSRCCGSRLGTYKSSSPSSPGLWILEKEWHKKEHSNAKPRFAPCLLPRRRPEAHFSSKSSWGRVYSLQQLRHAVSMACWPNAFL